MMSLITPISSMTSLSTLQVNCWDAACQTLRIAVFCLVSALVLRWLLGGSKTAKLPLINPATGWFDFWNGKEQRITHFIANAQMLIDQGMARYEGKPFNMETNFGLVTVLSPEIGHELRSEKSLAFLEANSDDFHGTFPGFDAFHPVHGLGEFLASVIRSKLTKSLGSLTKTLASESSRATETRFGSSTDWTTHVALNDCMDIISRVSTRLFAGGELCYNDAWHTAIQSYTNSILAAGEKLRRYPSWLRRFAAAYLVPECRLLRAQRDDARSIMAEVVDKRRSMREAGFKDAGDDALDWFEQESQGRPYDGAMLQVALAFAAIHTTSDLLTETLLRLAHRPELVREIRAEIATVLGENGWTKSSLYKMRLLDSVIKESQRLRPLTIAPMSRKTLRPITLSTGTVLPAGSRTVVSAHTRHSPAVYRDPFAFNGHRFFKKDDADVDDDDGSGAGRHHSHASSDNNNNNHLVSTGPASLGFGHGLHACPGRFFAAAEVKMALCYMLVRYDWELVVPGRGEGEGKGEKGEGEKDEGEGKERWMGIDRDSGAGMDAAEEAALRPMVSGLLLNVNHRAQVRVRRRERQEEEIDLDCV